MNSNRPRPLSALATAAFMLGLVAPATADEAAAVTPETNPHPLAWTFRYATSRSDYIRKNIRDYSCRLIKRERIDGELQKHQFIQVKVRCEQLQDGQVVRPLAVLMEYLAPGSLKGRKVLYVDGRNDGKMHVIKGGHALKYLRLNVDPNGTAARRDSHYPITDIGFDKMIERLIEKVTEDMKNDPTAANTQVTRFGKARVGDRHCTGIHVVHPQRGDGLQFHKASLYVDEEFQVPIRLEVYDWPPRDGEEPPIIEEYTYVNLQFNIGLTDADFSETQLGSSSDRNATEKPVLSR